MSVKTSTFEHWNKTKKYLPIINQLLILSNMILTWWDLQVGGKITGNKCVHYGFQEFEIASPYWTRTKQTYSLLTAGQKISLDEKSLEIIFWTLYLCALSSIIWKLAMRRTHANLLTVLCKQWYWIAAFGCKWHFHHYFKILFAPSNHILNYLWLTFRSFYECHEFSTVITPKVY